MSTQIARQFYIKVPLDRGRLIIGLSVVGVLEESPSEAAMCYINEVYRTLKTTITSLCVVVGGVSVYH